MASTKCTGPTFGLLINVCMWKCIWWVKRKNLTAHSVTDESSFHWCFAHLLWFVRFIQRCGYFMGFSEKRLKRNYDSERSWLGRWSRNSFISGSDFRKVNVICGSDGDGERLLNMLICFQVIHTVYGCERGGPLCSSLHRRLLRWKLTLQMCFLFKLLFKLFEVESIAT